MTDIAFSCSSSNGCELPLRIIEHHGVNRSGIIFPLIAGLQGGRGWDRTLVVDYNDLGRPDMSYHFVAHVTVTGSRKLGDSFSVTLADGNPLAILYDPPGGLSYASLSKGTSYTAAFDIETSSETQRVNDNEGGFQVNFDQIWCVGLGAMGCQTQFTYDMKNLYTTRNERSEGSSRKSSFSKTQTLQQTVTTSSDPVPG